MPSRAAEQQRQFVQYHVRVLAMNPIAYWPLDERSGTVAYGWAARPTGTQNGTHTGVTLGQPGIGDGRTSPYYDGAGDYTSYYSATFQAAFNGLEGTAAVWAKVNAAAQWTDGAYRATLYLTAVGGNDYIILRKSNVNNSIQYYYVANAVAKAAGYNTGGTLEWYHQVITWSKSADQVKNYFNGAQVGATLNGLGAWSNPNLIAVWEVIGNDNTAAPSQHWNGNIAHVAYWNRALSANEITDLYRTRWS